jgi:hypothetical protein
MVGLVASLMAVAFYLPAKSPKSGIFVPPGLIRCATDSPPQRQHINAFVLASNIRQF